jgi:hypothetical protein
MGVRWDPKDMKLWSALGLALALLPSPVPAQSMGEAAAKERERRKRAKQAGEAAAPVITEKELKSNRGQLANEPDAAPAARSSPPAAATSSAGTDARAVQEQKWRSRAAQLRARVDSAREQHEYWQAQHVTIGEYYVDEKGRTIARSAEDLQRIVAKAKAALDAAERGLADFEELARRESIPPGWLR